MKNKFDFIDQLPLTDEEKNKISSLALTGGSFSGPAMLYGLISKSINEFEEYFGKGRTWHLIRHLYPLLSVEEKAILSTINALEIK